MKSEFKKLKEIKLSDADKRELFERISLSIAEKEGKAQFKYPTPSPFYKFSYFINSHHLKVASFAVLILFFSSATAFASLDTLPGDLLYSVKTNVVERIPMLVYRSPEQKAQYNSQKIEKRIHEFEKLAEKGKLTEKNTGTIEENIHKNFSEFDENVQEIKKQKSEYRKAVVQKFRIENESEAEEEVEHELQNNLEKHTEKIKEIRARERGHNRKALEQVLERTERPEPNEIEF